MEGAGRLGPEGGWALSVGCHRDEGECGSRGHRDVGEQVRSAEVGPPYQGQAGDFQRPFCLWGLGNCS